MANFIHRLLNPHCPDCKRDRDDARYNEGTELLKEEVARLQLENSQLLSTILDLSKPKPVEVVQPSNEVFRPVAPTQFRSWKVKQEELERNDRDTAMKQAEKLKELKSGRVPTTDKPMTVAEIEKEIGVDVDARTK